MERIIHVLLRILVSSFLINKVQFNPHSPSRIYYFHPKNLLGTPSLVGPYLCLLSKNCGRDDCGH